ncbi:hypothetical protein K493DRAFT_352139 [Basidiobolus meristosporus CBS 931.73]|uniref:Uncharacterized protein n=1 Tax=Basidiobolus meristosporus CBS 931.73 TaxID=1314790 RepID=A0A1Y1YAT3_9FUNG|nr:hypothetical protein K493DRAFT_352139 [Basidiobolus meristosporus CBS 931.73]|eukprot:ORX94876.1 hypothetical protein K493DRAFT_352139 [Basidiobolus meristosporus CBS 931.73]
MEYEGKNPGNVEGGLKAAAHNPNVSAEKQQESLDKASQIHEERTGEPLKDQTIQKETIGRVYKFTKGFLVYRISIQQPRNTMEYEGKNPGNVEGGLKAAAHNPNVSAEKQQESLEKASQIHEERTGKPLKEQTIEKESKHSK